MRGRTWLAAVLVALWAWGGVIVLSPCAVERACAGQAATATSSPCCAQGCHCAQTEQLGAPADEAHGARACYARNSGFGAVLLPAAQEPGSNAGFQPLQSAAAPPSPALVPCGFAPPGPSPPTSPLLLEAGSGLRSPPLA